ncbi:hypothetical protein Ade02nite_38050 [Paractinoplanes deccanensis]|uniref:Lipoprotein n=2 Tax=Paractinoplanes deccanensis TaxID=113561 RepID=A0ABQ3Y598_9ACTN|nr:hypothetical protein Ade02nite_38050 [Actinoplanes deccanensis]
MTALVLAGCAKAEPPDTAAADASVDCGTYVLEHEALPVHAGTCLLDAARTGAVARLKVTRSTVEGDPIITAYATRPDGAIEVVEDTRADGFGPQEVTRETCTDARLGDNGLELSGCTS